MKGLHFASMSGSYKVPSKRIRDAALYTIIHPFTFAA